MYFHLQKDDVNKTIKINNSIRPAIINSDKVICKPSDIAANPNGNSRWPAIAKLLVKAPNTIGQAADSGIPKSPSSKTPTEIKRIKMAVNAQAALKSLSCKGLPSSDKGCTEDG